MTLGEKLQRLRRQGGLSQEQLAEQLSVSRQAVSKWELDETMPDTENVVQLSRLFGVSCDYLLLDEVDERGAPIPIPAPGETRLSQRGWVHNAFALSLAVCAVGLLLELWGWFNRQNAGPLIIGLIVQVGGLLLFELAAPRMGEGGRAARLDFYRIANWLVLPVPVWGLCRWVSAHVPDISSVYWSAAGLCFYLLLCVFVTAVLAVLRHRLDKSPDFGQKAD